MYAAVGDEHVVNKQSKYVTRKIAVILRFQAHTKQMWPHLHTHSITSKAITSKAIQQAAHS